MMRWVLAGAVAVVVAGCGGVGAAAPPPASPSPSASASATPSPVPIDPTRLRAEVSLSMSPRIFLGGDDNLALVVVNTGRPIERLAIDFSEGRWLYNHSVLTQPRSCDLEADQELLVCGRLESGDSIGIKMHAIAASQGVASYVARVVDLGGAAAQPVLSDSGAPLAIPFQENVVAIGSQLPGYTPQPSASPGG